MLRTWNLELQLEEKSAKAVYIQIADAIIRDIHTGRLKSGDALPGSRHLAGMLKVNRNTVVEALSLLIIEGWLTPKERQGTFVSDTLPVISDLGKHDVQKFKTANQDDKKQYIHFDDGHPDSKIAPVTELARAYKHTFNLKAKWQMMGYANEYGDLEFRKEMAQMLNHQRGMHLSEHQICITRGSQMAMYLTAQCLFTEGDYVMVENPGYQPAWAAFEHAGAKLLPVPVDQNGVIIDSIKAHLDKNENIKAIYITPHRQYPTTATLSLKRRLALIQLSNEYGFTIIEDDYDNEFHFGYRPLLPISSFLELKNYVYVGTLSKVVAPALRIGYLASNNHQLVENIGKLRKIIDVQGDNIMEQAVLQLIKDGTIRRHIKRATAYYKAKRDFTYNLLQTYLSEKATFALPEGGLAFWISPRSPINYQVLREELAKKGITFLSPESYFFNADPNGFRVGYAALNEDQLKVGIMALSKLL